MMLPDSAESGTRATTKFSELTTMAASASPNSTMGRRNSGGFSPAPTMRTSPPGKAAAGTTESMRGLPFVFFFAKMLIGLSKQMEPTDCLHDYHRQNPCRHIVHHDACSTRQAFQLPD